jgi:hypothetical protein
MRGYGNGRPAPAKQARVTRLYGDDEDEPLDAVAEQEVKGGLNARQKQMLEKQQLVGTVRLSAAVRRIIPYDVRNALAVVLAHPRDLDLPDEVRWSLDQKLQQSEDEFTRIDPIITVCTTINTGACNIYVKESVPISKLLMARALRLTYSVKITNKINTESYGFDDNAIVIKPYRGGADGRSRYANFGLSTLDFAREVGDDMLDQVDAHMLQLGPMSPADVCDPQWLDDEQEVVGALLRGERVALKAKPPTY